MHIATQEVCAYVQQKTSVAKQEVCLYFAYSRKDVSSIKRSMCVCARKDVCSRKCAYVEEKMSLA